MVNHGFKKTVNKASKHRQRKKRVASTRYALLRSRFLAALCEEELTMNCYTHTDSSAIGICKSCYKGVCSQCAIEIENGLACSETCKNSIVGVSGQKRAAPHPSAGVVFWAICSIILWISFLISYIVYGDFELSTLSFSIISTVVLVIASRDLNRKTKGEKST